MIERIRKKERKKENKIIENEKYIYISIKIEFENEVYY
jgi:hypothetical protein